MSVKSTSKEEALNTARKLVQEAMDVAHRAGIDPSYVLAPHCAETAATQDDCDERGSETVTWCGVPVIVDNSIGGLFEMSEPDDDAEQKPAFLVTQSTANLVQQDFERYQPSLERMVEDWQQKKKLRSSEKRSDEE